MAELAQAKSQARDVYRYWKIRVKGKSVTRHPERYQLDITKYKAELFTCIKPILAAYGISAEDLHKLQSELVEGELPLVKDQRPLFAPPSKEAKPFVKWAYRTSCNHS